MNEENKEWFINSNKNNGKWYTKQFLIRKIISKLQKSSKEKSTALMIVTIYALLSELWILFSGKFITQVLNGIFKITIPNIIIIEIYKGSIYVIISSVLLYLVIHKSMSKIRGLESELQASEERYQRLVKILPDAVTITKDDKYVFTNDAGARLLGLEKPEQIFKTPITQVIHPKYHKIAKERMYTTQYKKDCFSLSEEKYIRTDGTSIDVEVTFCIFNDDGQPAVLSVARDITERKKIEKALKSTLEQNKLLLDKMVEIDKIKTEFFSNMSHEFKTPLNIIFATVQVLNGCTSDDEIRISPKKLKEYINLTKQNCYRLLRLINNLIDITKIDSGYFEINYRNHDIISVVENISLSVAEFAKNKGISLIFDTEVEEKIMACDVDNIERIMLNLLSNSIKYTKPGGNIYVNIYDNEEAVTVSVKDTGIGIPKDKLKIIFERFMQVDSSLKRESEGSGIGLALVKSLVEKQGGEIWLRSEEGLGTELFIKIPVKELSGEHKDIDNYNINDNLVEKINIEFSDIYSIY